MTPEHKYIAERFERRTYIKGTFKGTFVGQLDRVRSDERYERFYDLEIIEGNIFTMQDNISRWPQSYEPVEFIKVSSFLTRPGEVRVALQYLDDSVKHFKIRLHELKLINCSLSRQVHKGNEVIGTIEGDVSGYVLHYNSTIEEIGEIKNIPLAGLVREQEKPKNKWTENTLVKKLVDYSNLSNKEPYNPQRKTGCLGLFGPLFALLLLAGSIVIARHWQLLSLFIIAGALLMPRLYNLLAPKAGLRANNRMVTIICQLLFLMTIVLVAGYYKQDLANEKSILPVADTSAATTFINSAAGSRKLATADAGQAKTFLNEQKYKEALSSYTELLAIYKNDTVFLYERAVCYNAIGRVQEAVNDLKKAIARGSGRANTLHEKINPLRTIQTGTYTLCRDGSRSMATGRGACSHHGGVAEWNVPDYEQVRQYK